MKLTLWIIIIIAILSGGATAVHAQEKRKVHIIEEWQCFDRVKYKEWEISQSFGTQKEKGPVLVRLKRLRLINFEYGEIEVSGSTVDASFIIEGINRRWDFGTSGDGFKFAFVIQPNKSAAYYDFTAKKRVSPSQLFTCEQR